MGALTGIAAVVRAYQYMANDGALLGIASMSLISLLSFYWAWHYIRLNAGDYSLEKLIHRDQDRFIFKGKPQSGYVIEQGIELDVSRLSVLTIRDDYLSVIVDGNGNGYDFFIQGTVQEIEQHIRSLLSLKEQRSIIFK